jgi:hypothetical protein
MIEVADVFRRFAAEYLDAHGATMPPSHQRAIADILACRTAPLGGQVWHCEDCGAEVFSYHSCGNRSCPKCHTLWRCPGVAVPEEVWRKDWIAHVTAWGKGEQAVLDYLARYVFRIALTNARIVDLGEAGVIISSRDRRSGRRRTHQLSGEEFMRRFLQHVLPRGFHKLRYCGLWHPAQCHNAAQVRQMLQLQAPPKADVGQDDLAGRPLVPTAEAPLPPIEPRICPHCQGRLIFIRRLTP